MNIGAKEEKAPLASSLPGSECINFIEVILKELGMYHIIIRVRSFNGLVKKGFGSAGFSKGLLTERAGKNGRYFI
ncbi:hypothetical protein [Brevibacillus daliensis]|uniref:hypothetical protein n=1 Tax=Brevibacillus daliensis TaxID=2892995 RepID=UPI001E59E98A|nr:hypothetical protein [Brevibacillus daliensis]